MGAALTYSHDLAGSFSVGKASYKGTSMKLPNGSRKSFYKRKIQQSKKVGDKVYIALITEAGITMMEDPKHQL